MTNQELHRALNLIGDFGLKEDGEPNAKTAAAVKKVQERLGLKPTGIVDDETRAALPL